MPKRTPNKGDVPTGSHAGTIVTPKPTAPGGYVKPMPHADSPTLVADSGEPCAHCGWSMSGDVCGICGVHKEFKAVKHG